MGEAQVQNQGNEDRILREAEDLASKAEWRKAALLIGNAGYTAALSPNARGAQAFYYSRAGDHDKAITLFTDLCQIEPAVARWPFYLGFQFQQKNRWDDAIASYEHAHTLGKKWIKIHLSLGQAYEETKQTERALSIYREGRQIYKELHSAARLKVVQPYGALCRQAAKLLLAKMPRQSEGISEALDCLCESAEAAPNDLNSWYRLVDCNV